MTRQSSAMVPRWRYFCVLYLQPAAFSTFQTCILNSHEGEDIVRQNCHVWKYGRHPISDGWD